MTSSGVDALGLHVADEVHEVAAVGLDRVVGQQRVADPGHQGPGDGGRSVAGLQGVGQEGCDLVGGRGVAVEEVAALGHEGRAGGAAGGRAGSWRGCIWRHPASMPGVRGPARPDGRAIGRGK